MDSEAQKKYREERKKESFEYFKKNRYFRKARALIIKDDKLVVLAYGGKQRIHYILPGGGVDPGEDGKVAAKREALEEVNMIVEPVKFIAKEYYTFTLEYEGQKYPSKRVSFYYICKFISYGDKKQMGLDGEFDDSVKVELLSIDDIKRTSHHHLNNMRPKTYKLVVDKLEKYINKNKQRPTK